MQEKKQKMEATPSTGTLLRQFRESLGLSRPELAVEIQRSVATVEKYEAEVPPELLEDLADLAERRGLTPYAEAFRSLAVQETAPIGGVLDSRTDEVDRLLLEVRKFGNPAQVSAIRSMLIAFASDNTALKTKKG